MSPDQRDVSEYEHLYYMNVSTERRQPMDNNVLRDFVYLDFERVRSYAAQSFGGVPRELVSQKTHETGGETEVGGGVPGVLSGKGVLNYHYVRSEHETKSLHHQVYSQLEEHLTNAGLVTHVDDNFDFSTWDESLFTDGQFVRITGSIRLLDYDWLASQFELLPKLFSTVEHVMTLSLNQRRSQGLLSDEGFRREKAKIKNPSQEIKEYKLEKFSGFLKQVYGDMIRVKILPSRTNPQYLFVASASRDCFADSPSTLSQKYGYSATPCWTVLGQINLGVRLADALSMPTGNAMEDAFEQVALSFGELLETTLSVSFPAVSLTPIAIFRLVKM
jgi:hypothetical protein